MEAPGVRGACSQDTEGEQHMDYTGIAEAVVKLLHPTIVQAVEQALMQGMKELKQDIQAHSKRIGDTEQRISLLDDDLHQAQIQLNDADKRFLEIQQKLDDLENRSCRNNIRVIGLPETYKPQHLLELCQVDIPRALGLREQCIAERAHRVGPLFTDRQSPRPIIVRYLNYVDRLNVLQKFRTQNTLDIEGHRLLLFADYSAKLSKKRRAFSTIRTQLHNKKIKFVLTYPAVLRITTPDGDQHPFEDPEEAEQFLARLTHRIDDRPRESIQERQAPLTPVRNVPKAQRKMYTPSPRRGRYKKY